MTEIQDIFKSIRVDRISPAQAKAFNMIRHCRTSTLGSHTEVCTDCGCIDVSYNSCRNRHCPKCQHTVSQKWVDAQLSKLLPVGYFHVVFTIPQELNTLVFQNQKLLYSLLMKSAGHTLMELAQSETPKYLGATTGVTAVLHTWGQNLSFHSHVHCIVPGGGLSSDDLRFVHSRKKFFIPVRVISRKFRGKFLFLLRQAFDEGKLTFYKDALHLVSKSNFYSLVNDLYLKDWVAFCKKPFKSPAHVVKYLGRYTHRVAISNSRIKTFNGNSVSFSWKDYKDGNKSKVMTLKATEFVRRFLLHVLPDRFTKIRHYGILCSRNIQTKLLKCMILTRSVPLTPDTREHTKCCRFCGSDALLFVFRNYSSTIP